MKNGRKVFGWISLAAAVFVFIMQTVLEKSGAVFLDHALFSMVDGILLLSAAVPLMNPAQNEKAMKQLKTDLKDERNTVIREKAAAAALFPVLLLLGVLASYLLCTGLTAAGCLVLGTDLAGCLIFGISVHVISSRM